jgi:hypothetical protein
MEAANSGMHFPDSGDVFRLSHRIDDATVAERGDNDQSSVLPIKGGCDPVIEFVVNRAQLRKARGGAARSVIHTELHRARRFQLLSKICRPMRLEEKPCVSQ